MSSYIRIGKLLFVSLGLLMLYAMYLAANIMSPTQLTLARVLSLLGL